MDKELEKRYRNDLKSSIRLVRKAKELDAREIQNSNLSLIDMKKSFEIFSKSVEKFDCITEDEKILFYGVYQFLKKHPNFTDDDFKKVIGSKLFSYAFIRELYKYEPNLVYAILQSAHASILARANADRALKENEIKR